MDFSIQKGERFWLKHGHFKIAKTIGFQTISLHFEPVSSSIEAFRRASDLLCADCQHIHSDLLNKIYVIWWRFAEMVFLQKMLQAF